MELTTSTIMGDVMRKLIEDGVTSFDTIAENMQRLKDMQNAEGLYSYDRFTETGSNSSGVVITEADGTRRDCILWCVNHYLGLNRNPRVIERSREAIAKFGTGSGTSAMSGGMSSLHKEVESRINDMVGKERVMLFPTGYSANLGAISAIPGKNDLILFDHQSHASIIDGCKLSGKQWLAFKHNNVADLEAKLSRLESKYENILVVVESAYSMSGDLAPLKEICALKRKHRFHLYVDEAHSFGFYGKGGRGYCYEQGVTDDVDFIMSTLSKATASIGGFVATKKKFCTLMAFHANAYTFQACISPGDAAAILASLDEIQNNPDLIEGLHRKTAYMRGRLKELGFDLGSSQSPIIPIYVRDPKTLGVFGRSLYRDGVFSVTVGFPAVKLSEGRLRFILNASHTQEQMDQTIDILVKNARQLEIIPQAA